MFVFLTQRTRRLGIKYKRLMKILENVDNSKFESALSIAKKYGYRLHDAYNKPDNYVLWSPRLSEFTVSYGTKPAMTVPTITVSGIVSGEVSRVIEERDKLNIAIELAKELEKLYSAHTVEESTKLEGNNVSSEIPDKIDSFLQDVAQMTNIISYNDIIKFGKKLSQSEQYSKYALGGIEHLIKMWGEALLYEDELMMDDIAYDIKSYMTFPIQKTVESTISSCWNQRFKGMDVYTCNKYPEYQIKKSYTSSKQEVWQVINVKTTREVFVSSTFEDAVDYVERVGHNQ